MKEKYQFCNLRLGKAHEGAIFCGHCGQILGYLFENRGGNCYLHFLCRCGNSGYLTMDTVPQAAETELADTEGNREVICSVCRKTLVTVTDRTVGFSFRVQCSCGHRFDDTRLRKRPVYQEK